MGTNNYDNQKARALLYSLGIQPYLRGYQTTLLALECIAENPECVCAAWKEIYLPTAERLQCEAATVEAAIRRASERAWKTHPALLNEISGEKLVRRPQVRIFLLTLYYACCTEE